MIVVCLQKTTKPGTLSHVTIIIVVDDRQPVPARKESVQQENVRKFNFSTFKMKNR